MSEKCRPPDTTLGVSKCWFAPTGVVPTSPDTLAPQHHAPPAPSMAQLVYRPMARSVKRRSVCTRTGSWASRMSGPAPRASTPQHQAVPSLVRAQV
jgi:hypothetical protein